MGKGARGVRVSPSQRWGEGGQGKTRWLKIALPALILIAKPAAAVILSGYRLRILRSVSTISRK
jgi:hypothetical protein